MNDELGNTLTLEEHSLIDYCDMLYENKTIQSTTIFPKLLG